MMNRVREGLKSVMEVPWDIILNGDAKPKVKAEEAVFTK